jgi:hypothetical protein
MLAPKCGQSLSQASPRATEVLKLLISFCGAAPCAAKILQPKHPGRSKTLTEPRP